MSAVSAGSLASATSSRVDSASKHITPCKVHTDYMASLLEGEVRAAPPARGGVDALLPPLGAGC